MKTLRIILPLFIGTLVYSLLVLSFGPKGFVPMMQLEREKQTISANLDSLYELRDDLKAKLDNLSADADTISIYAHELGYVYEGERLIRLAGFSGGIDRNLVPGTVRRMKDPGFLPEWICKLSGICAGLLAFFLFAHVTRKTHDGYRKSGASFG